MNVRIDDLVYRATDQELNMIRAMASKHLTWRKRHRQELAQAKATKRCKCGAEITSANPIIDRGYVYGIECGRCR